MCTWCPSPAACRSASPGIRATTCGTPSTGTDLVPVDRGTDPDVLDGNRLSDVNEWGRSEHMREIALDTARRMHVVLHLHPAPDAPAPPFAELARLAGVSVALHPAGRRGLVQ